MAFLRKHNKSKILQDAERRNDIGFGTQVTDASTRLVNKDGSFNVRRLSESFWAQLSIYHQLITMSWTKFILIVTSAFFVANFIFAALYELVGVEHLAGIDLTNEFTKFYDAYFFSAQTLTTVGYGRIAPHGFWASTIASIESLMGLLTFALATGLLYGRFSRPVARVLYSKNAIIAPYLNITGLMFRIINEGKSRLLDLSAEISFSILVQGADGKKSRTYHTLPLERNRVQMFPISWTIVHPITEDSPLFGLSQQAMLDGDAEFFVLIKGMEDTFNQTVHSRMSYHVKEMVWGAKYESMLVESSGVITVDFGKLSNIREAPLVSEYDPNRHMEAVTVDTYEGAEY